METEYPLSIRINSALRKTIDGERAVTGESRAETIRELIKEALRARGAWPPAREA